MEKDGDGRWPQKLDLFGVGVSATSYDDLVVRLLGSAKTASPAIVTFLAVHGLMTAVRNAEYRDRINQFDIVAPDGQPLRWALNRFHDTGLTDRVYGPEAMRRLCQAASHERLPIFLYGSHAHVIDRLAEQLTEWFPSLDIAGRETMGAYPLSPEEDERITTTINASGARLVFLGLGCPRQEQFAAEHRHRIRAVQLCVGAAFDFHAGVKKMAPPWMQDRGLEWLFRMSQEPRRLAGRYTTTNSQFVFHVTKQMLRRRTSPVGHVVERVK